MKIFSKLLLLPLIALTMSFSLSRIAAPANFSGKWKLNEGKSDLGQFANFANRVIEVNQTTDSLNIARTANSFEGSEVVSNERLKFDGKEIENAMFAGAKKKSTVAWSEDGKAFTITYTLLMDFNGQTNEIKGKEVWSLSDDGKLLTVKNNSSSSFGEFATTSVYDKQ